MRRAQVVLASAQGFAHPRMGEIALMSQDYVRSLIKIVQRGGIRVDICTRDVRGITVSIVSKTAVTKTLKKGVSIKKSVLRHYFWRS
ncbi:MAG: hypothetical protein ACRECH_06320 [Nitrososphaerales archaeon]